MAVGMPQLEVLMTMMEQQQITIDQQWKQQQVAMDQQREAMKQHQATLNWLMDENQGIRKRLEEINELNQTVEGRTRVQRIGSPTNTKIPRKLRFEEGGSLRTHPKLAPSMRIILIFEGFPKGRRKKRTNMVPHRKTVGATSEPTGQGVEDQTAVGMPQLEVLMTMMEQQQIAIDQQWKQQQVAMDQQREAMKQHQATLNWLMDENQGIRKWLEEVFLCFCSIQTVLLSLPLATFPYYGEDAINGWNGAKITVNYSRHVFGFKKPRRILLLYRRRGDYSSSQFMLCPIALHCLLAFILKLFSHQRVDSPQKFQITSPPTPSLSKIGLLNPTPIGGQAIEIHLFTSRTDAWITDAKASTHHASSLLHASPSSFSATNISFHTTMEAAGSKLFLPTAE
ncbi:hypothetical protein HHK36_032176 [Tetracentron sinense]|uniref:Uncharacterized protein n=1 Tax=Tetracentron sinense TaxID=13715 RepID=A0A834Y9J3_TETSI|nr:hypothetical protein HHK36_032176 [Tetracentron sinense]